MTNLDNVIREQLKNKSTKNRLFFIGVILERFLFIYDKMPDATTRANLLKEYYIVIHYLQDYVRGIIPAANGVSLDEKRQFLESKLDFIQNNKCAKDVLENVMYDSFRKTEYLGFSLEDEMTIIIKELLWDCKRMQAYDKFGKIDFKTKKQLDQHFYNLDVAGKINGYLKIFDEDLSDEYILYYLGTSSREYHDLKDFLHNLNNGIINISEEERKNFGISDVDVRIATNLDIDFRNKCRKESLTSRYFGNLVPKSIRDYYVYKAHSCQKNLRRFNMLVNRLNLKTSAEVALYVSYEKPIRRFLRKVDY